MDTNVSVVKHEGVKIQLGDGEYVMPRLTAGGLKKHWPKIKALRKMVQDLAAQKNMDALLDAAPDLMSAQIALIHYALKRNYPMLTLEEVEDGLELSQVKRVFERLVEFSHFEKLDSKPEGDSPEAESPQS